MDKETAGILILNTRGIKQELSRVRELKRNAEATIELLRSDMEQGKIHLRVNESQAFRQKVAEALVTESHPGYHSQGYYYADPVEGEVYYRQTNASWNPWSDAINWRIVAVDELANEGNSFDPSVDWNAVDLPDYREIVKAYLEEEKEDFEDNGDIPSWVSKEEVMNFATFHDQWKEEIEKIKKNSHEQAISFALSEIKDEVIVKF